MMRKDKYLTLRFASESVVHIFLWVRSRKSFVADRPILLCHHLLSSPPSSIHPSSRRATARRWGKVLLHLGNADHDDDDIGHLTMELP